MNEAYDTPFMRALLAADPHALYDDGRQERYRDRSRNFYTDHDATPETSPDLNGLLCTGDQHESYD